MTKKSIKTISIIMLIISSLGILLNFILMWNDVVFYEQQFSLLLRLCYVGIVCSVGLNVGTIIYFKKDKI